MKYLESLSQGCFWMGVQGHIDDTCYVARWFSLSSKGHCLTETTRPNLRIVFIVFTDVLGTESRDILVYLSLVSVWTGSKTTWKPWLCCHLIWNPPLKLHSRALLVSRQAEHQQMHHGSFTYHYIDVEMVFSGHFRLLMWCSSTSRFNALCMYILYIDIDDYYISVYDMCFFWYDDFYIIDIHDIMYLWNGMHDGVIEVLVLNVSRINVFISPLFVHKTPQSEVSKLSASTEKSEPAIERTGFTTWNCQSWSHGQEEVKQTKARYLMINPV